eukprot:scaffold35634_cov36-Phaeocystis_antarctica.AAC.1
MLPYRACWSRGGGGGRRLSGSGSWSGRGPGRGRGRGRDRGRGPRRRPGVMVEACGLTGVVGGLAQLEVVLLEEGAVALEQLVRLARVGQLDEEEGVALVHGL